MVTCEKINYMHALLFNNSFKTIYIFSLFGFFGKRTTCYHSGIGEAPIEKLELWVVTSSVPNLQIRRNLNNSGSEKDIAKRKTPSFFALKGPFNKLIFK